MLSPDEITQTTDALEGFSTEMNQTTEALEDLSTGATQTTDALGRLPHPFGRRTVSNERRQRILQHKQTDVLPRLTMDASSSRMAWRQVMQLREENKRLRFELEEVRAELVPMTNDYATLRSEFEKEISIIHNGHQQEIDYYRNHLHEMIKEHNSLQKDHQELENRYAELERTFHDRVADEASKMVVEVAQSDELVPATVTSVLAGFKEAARLQVRREEDKHLLEALYLKREAQRVFELLEQERKQIDEEHQRLLVMQNTAREQAELRQKLLQARLNTRWLASLIASSVGLLCLLVVLQFVFMRLLHIPIVPGISFALIAPIIICAACSVISAGPGSFIKYMYHSAPHKRKVRGKA